MSDTTTDIVNTVVGVVGAGAMGAGIAQVAAVHGHAVVLADAQPASIARAPQTRHRRRRRWLGDRQEATESGVAAAIDPAGPRKLTIA